jgi:hypothetical protein
MKVYVVIQHVSLSASIWPEVFRTEKAAEKLCVAMNKDTDGFFEFVECELADEPTGEIP